MKCTRKERREMGKYIGISNGFIEKRNIGITKDERRQGDWLIK